MKISTICFIITGFAICNAIYIGADQKWFLMSTNILMAVANLANGLVCYRDEASAQYWKGHDESSRRFK